MKKILIINGPNLNMLGKREQEIYGNITLNELEKICADEAKKLDFNIYFFQSNSEAEIIDKIQECNHCDGLIVIAGVGTRNYYRKLNYEIDYSLKNHGEFMIKYI